MKFFYENYLGFTGTRVPEEKIDNDLISQIQDRLFPKETGRNFIREANPEDALNVSEDSEDEASGSKAQEEEEPEEMNKKVPIIGRATSIQNSAKKSVKIEEKSPKSEKSKSKLGLVQEDLKNGKKITQTSL